MAMKFKNMMFRLRGKTDDYEVWDRVCIEDGTRYNPPFILILDTWGEVDSNEDGPKVKHQRGDKL